MSFGTAAGVMRPRACGRAFWHLFILACAVPAQRDADAATQQQCACARSIKWQYNVPIELLLLRPPRPDLAGNTPQVADLSSMQIQVFDYKRRLIATRNVGRDAVFRDNKWTAVEDLLLEWGMYTIEVQSQHVAPYAMNVTLPRDAQCGTYSSCAWAAPLQKLDTSVTRSEIEHRALAGGLKERNRPSTSLEVEKDPKIVRSSARTLFQEQIARMHKGKSWDGGRRAGMGCGGEGQKQCVCHEDFCCSAPAEVRSAFQTYRYQSETLTGRSVRVTCHNGYCNVTLDTVPAPGCENLNCLLDVCQDDNPKTCSIFTPQYCTSCTSCLGTGLGAWCFNQTKESGECQAVQRDGYDDYKCTLASGNPGRTCSECGTACGTISEGQVSTPATTPPPVDDAFHMCRQIASNRTHDPSECDSLIEEMWCDQDCAVIFGILTRLHNSGSRQPLGTADIQALCGSTCYFTKYKNYLTTMDLGTCSVNLDVSFLPPAPYILKGFLPGDLPSKMGFGNESDLARFAETICIYTEATIEDPTEGYCVDIVTQAAIKSDIQLSCAVGMNGDRVVEGTNFSTWKCPPDCIFAMSEFVKDSGCCLYSLEYPRYAMGGYPFFIKDLASACKVTEYTMGLDQPCAGALSSRCGAKSVCMNDGHDDLCLCTGQNYHVKNISGSPQCVDQDECELGKSFCHADATCINSPGSYLCLCNDGFVGDGILCTERSCDLFKGLGTCILCGDECCAADDRDPATFRQVVDIGCSASGDVRDMNKRILASASRSNDETCFENTPATLSDCRGNKSLAKPCALWAKHDYFCTNLSYPPKYISDAENAYRDALAQYSRFQAQIAARPFMQNCSNGTWTTWTGGPVLNCTSIPYSALHVPTPPTAGWGLSQFWCVRNASGTACDGRRARRVVAEGDGIGLRVGAMCQADGSYNATVSCERVKCGQYTAPMNGLVDGEWSGPPEAVTPQDMYFPESLFVSCNAGYDLFYDGARSDSVVSVKCLPDSTYSVTEKRTTCVPKNCGVYSNFITRTASLILYKEDLTSGTNICNGRDAGICKQQCCDCLSRLRDCWRVGCPECNHCSMCTVLATACPGMCPNQAVLPPEIVEAGRRYTFGHDFNLSYKFGQQVTLACYPGYALAQVLKNEGLMPVGEAQPKCVNSDDGVVGFQNSMSCLAKACTPLSVQKGAVMPNTATCNDLFADCVQRIMKVTKGLDETNQPLDVNMTCMEQLSKVDQCRPDSQVLLGNQIRIVCQLGYTSAAMHPSCNSNGTFSNYASCERQSCGIFTVGEHATSESHGREVRYMDRVIVKCNSGFGPIEQILECKLNGVLEVMEGGGRLAPCGPIECGELYTPNSQILSLRNPNEFYIECNPGFVIFPFDASPEVQCTSNGTYSTVPQCLDYNECEEAADNCTLASTRCENNGGSYTCECLPGFRPLDIYVDESEMEQNQVSCEDINECLEIPRKCDRDATCFNSPGSFSCSCNTGYGPAGYGGDGKDCARLQAVLLQAPSSGVPSSAGVGLSNQPRIGIETVAGLLSPTPWDQTHQLVTASLLQVSSGGTSMTDVTHLLMGNLTADAPDGVADFTDLDVIKVGSGFQLQFSISPQWKVEDVRTASFTVKAGQLANLRVRVQPSVMGATMQALDTQPVIELMDKFGNFKPDAVPTMVSVKMSAVDKNPAAFLTWNAGATEFGSVESVNGLATFTQLTLFGVESWYLDFEAEVQFRTVSVRAAQPIILRQMKATPIYFTFQMEFSDWSIQYATNFTKVLADVCKLDASLVEITKVNPGSVVAEVAMYVPNSPAYWKLILDDFAAADSKLKAAGAISFKAPGVAFALTVPRPPPPPPAPRPYTGIPFDVVHFWSDITQGFVISAYSMGIGMAIFTEVAASFAQAARISELAAPEGGRVSGNRWHTGAGLQSGGAFRTLITQVQFVAALSSIGGRGGQPHFFFTFPEPGPLPVGQAVKLHNHSLIKDVRLPYGMRELAGGLDWTNLRSNSSSLLGDADVFPRPCDVYAQQVTIGTCFVVLFIQVAGYFVRVTSHKVVERVTLLKYGQASTSAAIQFPKWESVVITNTYYGVTQVVGICIGSFCTDWMIGGCCLGAFPVASWFLMTYCTYLAVSVHRVVKFVHSQPVVSRTSQRLVPPRLTGKWKRQLQVSDSACTVQLRYLMLFASAFNDLRDGYATYYGSFSMLLRMVCGISSGAAHDWQISATIFVALYGLDFLILAITYPYLDLVRNRFEVLLASIRAGLSVVGYMYLRGNIGIDAAELSLFWLGIGGIAFAFLYQAVEIGVHIWSIAQRREHQTEEKVMAKERWKSHISSQSAENENAVLVPLSATAFREVILYDEMGDEHKILDQRHLVLHVHILGATDLKSVDCRRNRTMCIVKIGANDILEHHGNFGGSVMYHDGEAVYKTSTQGFTLKAHSAWWNEKFAVQIDDERAVLTFALWEFVDKGNRYLGTAIVHLEPLLEQLHSRNEPVEKKYQVISQAEVVANLDRMEVKPDMLEAGALGIRFECAFPRLWKMSGSALMNNYRLKTLESTYVDLTLQDTIKPGPKYSRSEEVRAALLGTHIHKDVSKAAAAANRNKAADATWRMRENSDVTALSAWDRGMPEGDENERHGFSRIEPTAKVTWNRHGDEVHFPRGKDERNGFSTVELTDMLLHEGSGRFEGKVRMGSAGPRGGTDERNGFSTIESTDMLLHEGSGQFEGKVRMGSVGPLLLSAQPPRGRGPPRPRFRNDPVKTSEHEDVEIAI